MCMYALCLFVSILIVVTPLMAWLTGFVRRGTPLHTPRSISSPGSSVYLRPLLTCFYTSKWQQTIIFYISCYTYSPRLTTTNTDAMNDERPYIRKISSTISSINTSMPSQKPDKRQKSREATEGIEISHHGHERGRDLDHLSLVIGFLLVIPQNIQRRTHLTKQKETPPTTS